MSQRRWRLCEDRRGGLTVAQLTWNSPLVLLIVAVLGIPPAVATAGALARRENAFQYAVTAAASLVATFVLTGVTQFRPLWTGLGIAAVLVAMAGHVWQTRGHRVDLLVTAGIYLPPTVLAFVLLFNAVTVT